MRNLTDSQIAEAFQPHVDAATAWYDGRIRKVWASFADEDGIIPADKRDELRRLGNAFGQRAAEWRMVRSFAQDIDGTPAQRGAMAINEDRLAKQAARFGEEQVAAFIAKLTKKLGDLDVAEILHASSRAGEFTIVGELDGHRVTVEQQRIFKVSPKGNLYCQWPARIYVDGQFTPEKEFKARFAA